MRRRLFFCLLVAALPACRTRDPEEPARERVAVDPAGGRRPAAAPRRTDDWFRAEFQAAEEEEARGDLKEALERIDRALRESPPADVAASFSDLRAAIHRRVLELPTLEGRIVPAKDPLVFGEAVPVVVRLENTSRKRVVVAGPAPGVSPSVLDLEVERRDYDTRGQVVRTTRRVAHPFPQTVELGPGGVLEQTFLLANAGNEQPFDGVRLLRVRGLFRPARLEVGGVARWDAVRLEAGTVRAFRANWEPLAKDPVASIGQAIAKRAPSHLLTAAALLEGGRRREGVDRMVAALGRDRALDPALCAALELLTEAGLGSDPDPWTRWWAEVRETFFGRAPEAPPPGTPRFGR